MVDWTFESFESLSCADLYDILRQRQDVFVLEQKCFYPDIDGKDHLARHLIGRAEDGTFLAYLRVLGPGDYYDEPALGRVLVTPEARGRGLARKLMEEGMPVPARSTETRRSGLMRKPISRIFI